VVSPWEGSPGFERTLVDFRCLCRAEGAKPQERRLPAGERSGSVGLADRTQRDEDCRPRCARARVESLARLCRGAKARGRKNLAKFTEPGEDSGAKTARCRLERAKHVAGAGNPMTC
jgi:hypothetical protein